MNTASGTRPAGRWARATLHGAVAGVALLSAALAQGADVPASTATGGGASSDAAGAAPGAPAAASATEPGGEALDRRAEPDGEAPRVERVQACLDAHERGQVERQRGQLRAARATLAACADPACPSLLRSDCVRWADELSQAIPSLLVSVREGDTDLSDVVVLVDGTEVLADAGRPLELDPGRHVVEVRLSDGTSLSREVVVAEGDRLRRVDFEVPGAEATPAPVESYRPAPRAFWILAGTATVATGLFVGLGAAGLSERNELSATCAPACASSDVDRVDGLLLAADVSLGVALAAGAGAIVTWVARPERARGAGVPPEGSTSIALGALSGGPGFQVGRTFR